MKVPFLTKAGKVESFDIPDGILDRPMNRDLLHRAVVWMASCEQQGTHSTKTRGEVRGGGRKPWRQKGTGRARHGSRRSPIWVGGGVIFGPKPRSHAITLPRKMRRLALQIALSDKARHESFFVAEDLIPPVPKTKEMVKRMERWEKVQRPILLITQNPDQKMVRASRNLQWLSVAEWPAVSVPDVLKAKSIIADVGMVPQLVGGFTES